VPSLPELPGNATTLARRLRVGQLLALIGLAPAAILVASVVVGILSLAHQTQLRGQLLNQVEPAEHAALQLATAMVNQETGIRGYELTGRNVFLQPYHLGLSEESHDLSVLHEHPITGTSATLRTSLASIRAWQDRTALPALRTRPQLGSRTVTAVDVDVAGKHRFDAIRAALGTLQTELMARVRVARADLNNSAAATGITFAVIAGVLLLTAVGVAVALRRLVNLPLARLTTSARRVAGGELEHSLRLRGPRDIEQLADDVDGMRRRLLAELDAVREARNRLSDATLELERSNAELEQFAYVASHDLQEPLRKVTSFVQLLAERYRGQLDERADQYIGFAVDGSLRMQQLINDLLAFSRVGRAGSKRAPVDLGRLARAAADDLQQVVQETGGEVVIDPLPELPVEASLLRAAFQNLIGNALKFHGDDPPRVHVEGRREGREWLFSCTDNGIGIEPAYAERIFVIFQRLHSRDRYPGTGIGLAMCRKIIEYHGGRIWLDSGYGPPGARIWFTLPAAP